MKNYKGVSVPVLQQNVNTVASQLRGLGLKDPENS